ncbi:MAG: apolipoprotein N-acyltransferase [Actinobacteria bacterium]|nr:apolipoprotein N-acyltransferase [Actinomycetota bacterium]
MIDPRTLRALLRAVIAGLCLAASVPPWGWWPLAFLGIAMWDRLLRNAKPRARIVRSIVFAAAWFTPSMLWMVDLTAPGYLIAIVVFSLYVGIAGLAVPGRSSSAWVRWLALPAAFTLAEAARCTFPFGGVPLATTAMGQASAPLGQIARVLCAVGVTFAVAVIGVALSAAWERRHVVAAAALAGVIALWLAAIVAPSGSDIRTINAAVVQGGGPQGTRATETDPRDVFDRHIEASSLITTPVDLVVWPENVVAVDAPIASARENTELSALAKDLNTTLVAGVTEDLDSSSFANASIVYLPDGSTGERYDKVRRVPFGEYVPLRWLIESVAGTNTGIPVREARAGTEPAIVRTPAGDLAIAISWEIFFTNRGRDGVLHGGQILLNPTNGSSYWLTQVQTQQVASSQLRAIETGRWVLQAAPTGFSAIVNPSGDVLERTSISEQAALQQDVMLRSGDTIATVIGPMPVIWFSAILLALSWWFATNHFEAIGSKLKPRRGE